MTEQNEVSKHDLTLKDRKQLEMTDVSDVVSFDENTVNAKTKSISICIEGENLKIEKFDADHGILQVSGLINGIYYEPYSERKKKKTFGDLFR